jgi:cob(I)alamin adenosyltransferase
MVTLSKIYTKTGDSGETSLGDGNRVAKHSLRVSAYGTVDETNATVGLAKLYTESTVISTQLAVIQNDLFDLGADLCRPDHQKDSEAQYQPLRMTSNQVKRLETEIDLMNKNIEPLRSFILPGGSKLAAHLHLCRTVSRRAERLTVELSESETVNAHSIQYLNRLSDWFFVAARVANSNGKDDILWVPGANR